MRVILLSSVRFAFVFIWLSFTRCKKDFCCPQISCRVFVTIQKSVAVAIGLLSICNVRHRTDGVVAGAGIVMANTKLAYWLYPHIFSRHSDNARHVTMVMPAYADGGCTLTASVQF